MKSSNLNNLLECNPQLEDHGTMSQFSYYQPFQAGLDFGLGFAHQNSSQLSLGNISPDTPIKAVPDTPWNRISLSPSPCTPFQAASSSICDMASRRIFNSTWITPGSSGHSPSAPLEHLTPETGATGGPEFYAQFPPNDQLFLKGFSRATHPFLERSPVGFEELESSSFGSGRLGLWRSEGSKRFLGFEEPEGSSLGFERYQKRNFEYRKLQESTGCSRRGEGLSPGRVEEAPSRVGSAPNQGQRFGASRLTKNYPKIVNQLNWNNNNRSGNVRPMMCGFCKNNKEVPDIYLNHYLYDPYTKVLTCPVLRKHVCEICGGTGDQAHTLQYCPMNKGKEFQAKIPLLLKSRTITDSTGKIRRN